MRELHGIRKAHEKAMKAQRYGFQMELEKVKVELHQVESRLITLKYEINTLKSQKQISKQRSTQDTLATKNALTIPSSMKSLKEKEPTDLFLQKLRSDGRFKIS